jgi:hypothetical protein
VRLVRFGAETSQVGADVRAALASWGTADTVFGGIALLGVTPLGVSRPVEAVIVVPRGVVVVVGVDLPDPAVRLDAPLNGQWRADGWPLVRGDGAVNPAEEALAAARAVTFALADRRLAPIPVSTIVAVGPYVGQVVQSTGDLHSGFRVLHPEPKPMLAAMRELAVADRPCSVEQAHTLLRELAGDQVSMLLGEIAAEGFADAVTPDLASANTTLLPKITERMSAVRQRRGRRPFAFTGRTRWLTLAAVGLIVVLAVGLVLGLSSGGGPPARAASTAPPKPLTLSGVAFHPEGSRSASSCVSHAYGDVRVWLTSHPCTGLVRSLYRTVSHGRPAAVALAAVDFADATTAKAFGTEANSPGTGGVTDLVAEGGDGWPDGPKSFDNAAYTVAVSNTTVRLTEVVWVTGTSRPTDPALTRLAAISAGLPASP